MTDCHAGTSIVNCSLLTRVSVLMIEGSCFPRPFMSYCPAPEPSFDLGQMLAFLSWSVPIRNTYTCRKAGETCSVICPRLPVQSVIMAITVAKSLALLLHSTVDLNQFSSTLSSALVCEEGENNKLTYFAKFTCGRWFCAKCFNCVIQFHYSCLLWDILHSCRYFK